MTQRQINPSDPNPACPYGHPVRLIHDQRRYTAWGGSYVDCRCFATRKHGSLPEALADWAHFTGNPVGMARRSFSSSEPPSAGERELEVAHGYSKR